MIKKKLGAITGTVKEVTASGSLQNPGHSSQGCASLSGEWGWRAGGLDSRLGWATGWPVRESQPGWRLLEFKCTTALRKEAESDSPPAWQLEVDEPVARTRG